MNETPGELKICNHSDDVWCILWETFGNASMTYDLISSSSSSSQFLSTSFLFPFYWWWNGIEFHNNNNNSESENIFDYSLKWGFITGLFILILFTESQIIPAKIDNCLESTIKNIAFTVLNILFFILIAPFIAVLLIFFFIYRKIIDVVLKVSMGDIYGGLLEGTDSIWAVEDTSGLSIINALGVLEMKKDNIDVLSDLRNLVKDRLISPNFEKLWWTRNKKYGYYYWQKTNEINLKQRVRWLNSDEREECDGNCNDIHKGLLKRLITKVCNQPLPQQHSICWEILIGNFCKKCQVINDGNNQSPSLKQNIPVLFRIHHSLGDGVALLRLLLEVIADNENFNCSLPLNQEKNISYKNVNDTIDDEQRHIPLLRQRSSFCGKLIESQKIIYYSADLLSASMPFITNELALKNFTWRKINIRIKSCYQLIIVLTSKIYKKIIKTVNEFLRYITALILLPSFLFHQALRCMDNSAIHGPLLTGNKIISCWLEDLQRVDDNNESSLLEKIRDIKNITGVRFGDVILAALSTNIHKYFHQIGKSAPKKITVVVPMRMSVPNQKLTLNNGFSVGLLPLCVSSINGKIFDFSSTVDSNDPWRSFDRLYDISQSSAKLRNNYDYLINYWVMDWLSAALPEFFLRPLLHSRSTMVFSNLPGPQAIKILGNTLKRVVFWIPNRGTTGIGCAFLSYNGSVNLSILADKSVINNEICLDEIVKGTVNEIKKMHENIQRAYLLKNFKLNSKTHMKRFGVQ
ncbi:uncharacterized protein [Chelonus insularis]|nr:uncharacterized protein LOC118067795 isoform X2 [Chelonus insularis]